MPARRFGCAFFERPATMSGSAWACVAGEEPKRVTGVADLLADDDTLWITSTHDRDFELAGGRAHANIKPAGYLATPLSAIVYELGAMDRAGAEAAAMIAEILARVCRLAAEYVGGVDSSPDFGAYESLAEFLRAHIAPAEADRVDDQSLCAALRQATPAQFALGSPAGNDLQVRVPANRLMLLSVLDSIPVPSGDWSRVPTDDRNVNPIAWAADEKKPVFALVSIVRPRQGIKSIAPQAKHLTKGKRLWMALPEILTTGSMYEIQAEEMIVASDQVAVTSTMRIPMPIFSPAAYASISASLFAECLVHALMAPYPAAVVVSGAPNSATPELPAYSAQAAWLLASARAIMMNEAHALAKIGFQVTACSPSHLTVSLHRKQLHGFRQAIGKSNMLACPCGLLRAERAWRERRTPVEA